MEDLSADLEFPSLLLDFMYQCMTYLAIIDNAGGVGTRMAATQETCGSTSALLPGEAARPARCSPEHARRCFPELRQFFRFGGNDQLAGKYRKGILYS